MSLTYMDYIICFLRYCIFKKFGVSKSFIYVFIFDTFIYQGCIQLIIRVRYIYVTKQFLFKINAVLFLFCYSERFLKKIIRQIIFFNTDNEKCGKFSIVITRRNYILKYTVLKQKTFFFLSNYCKFCEHKIEEYYQLQSI